jgi:hypothetical protein
MRDNYYLFGLGAKERSYAVNGVTYQVGSRFTPIDFKAKKRNEKTVFDRVCHYLNNGFADLTDAGANRKMESEYVCPAAKEGGSNAAETQT